MKLKQVLGVVAALAITGVLVMAIFLSIEFTKRRPINDEDATHAALQITRWVLAGQPLPGTDLEVMDLALFKDQIIVLTFVGFNDPPGGPNYVPDRKIIVRHIEDAQQILEAEGYQQHSYIRIIQQSRGPDCVHFDVSVRFGPRGGQGYQFTATKGLRGLSFQGSLAWMS